MLKKIVCDKFINNTTITFKDGLNVIAGDSIASNSIGKTTVLMIIDFVFGGDGYTSINSDVMEHVNHHIVKFSFTFNGTEYYFSRSTENRNEVLICNENFEEVSSITIKDYLSFLKTHYDCDDLSLSFRDIQGRYFRIYGKKNIDEKRPLHYVGAESYQKTTNALIQLFDKFMPIQALEEKMKLLSNESKLLSKATKKKIVHSITSREYPKYQAKITELQVELNDLKETLSQNSLNIKTDIADQTVRLYRQRSSLSKIKEDLENKIARLKETPERRMNDISYELGKLKRYLPLFDTNPLNEIQRFHTSLLDALKEEYRQSLSEFEERLSDICMHIDSIDRQIEKSLNIEGENKKLLDRVIEIALEIKNKRAAMDFHDYCNTIKSDLESSNKELSDLKPHILSEIAKGINNNMEQLIQHIFHEGHKPPRIEFGSSSYSFRTEEDRGTGTAFVNLIAFDLSVLTLTKLPALIHDLPLLKNIENSAIEEIVKLYSEHKKQIFISLDKIDSYSQDTIKIIDDSDGELSAKQRGCYPNVSLPHNPLAFAV